MIRFRSIALAIALVGMVTVWAQTRLVRGQSNVVVIISDDAGWADYGFMRNADSAADPGNAGAIPTPNLDALAARGVTFTNAYTGSVCSPSRAMITTGQYGTRFGYATNIAGSSQAIDIAPTVQGLPTEITTAWEYMQGAGYDTAAIGKWHIGEHANGGGQLGNRPENQGVEFFQGLWAGSRGYTAGSATGSQALRQTISDGAGSVSSNSIIESSVSGQYVTDVFGDQSADYIKNNAASSDPFYLYTSFTAPHTPLDATAGDLSFIDSLGLGLSGNRRTYAAMQYAMDRNVGKIIDALVDPAGDGTGAGNDADNILDDTMIIFMNDNGGDCCDGSPNASNNGDLRNGKGSQFEGGMRVPMIVSGAGVDLGKRGTVSADLVHSIDIVPTAFEGAGGASFAPGDTIDGVNLLPFINDTVSGVAHEDLFISRFSNQQSAVRMGKWKYMYQTGTGYQLYDLDVDIDESNNLINNAANAAVAAEAHELLASYHVQMDKPRHDNNADNTNQFDHFRFRESNFSAAAFSTANAWVNGDTGSGTATATWRDGYANNRLTFRAKASGDYTATNDLRSVGGFGYMANQINLASASAPVSTEGIATINGQPVMLTNSLGGAAPEINLDATDAMPKQFTFKIEHDVEVYDHLSIQGDGNQNFEINGQIREFRSGLNVTKTGSSDLTLGGGIAISGTLQLDGGRVSFTSGEVTGNVIAAPTSAIVVGGTGFNETSGPPAGPEIVTTNLDLHYNAATDISGDSIWTEQSGSGSDLSFTSAVASAVVNDQAFPGITRAYNIPASGEADGLNNFFEGDGPRSRLDATFEVWFNVSNTAAGGNQVIFEVGATRGVSFTLDDDTLQFNVDGDGSLFTLSETVSAGWHQAVGIIDLVGNGDNLANDSMSLYLDNVLVGTLDNLLIDDWAGGNLSSIGGDSAGTAGGSPIDYHGDIAIARYYRNTVFDSADVDQNFQVALFDAGEGALQSTLLEIDGDYAQHTGASLELDLLDIANHDAVSVLGAAALSGTLDVFEIDGFAPNVGDTYTVLSASGGVTGEFDAVNLPALVGLEWLVDYTANDVTLSVIYGADFNSDGAVNGADFLIWQRGSGLTGQTDNTNGDADGNGIVDLHDLQIWQSRLQSQLGVSSSAAAAVPELSSGLSAIWGTALLLLMKPW
ncbi:MAG: sulfatase-like hydrolase/transferase [Planctomycetota bacterium]